MNDEASRRQEKYRQLRRRGEAPEGGDQSPEQRYASAVAAMNQMVSSQDFEALPWVTEVFHRTVRILDDANPARASVLNNLGSATQLNYLRSQDPTDLENAVAYYRAAASVAHEDDNDHVLYLGNLTLALTDQAAKVGDPKLAQEALATARRAAERTGRRDPRRILVLVRLGHALKSHARLAGDTTSDDESIDVFREAARIAAPADRVDLLINLGSALLRRYERRGAIDDLDDGIEQLRIGIDGLADGEPRRLALCHLANALRLRFQRVGDLGDLHAAINELLGVLGVLDAGHPLAGKVIWGLSCAIAEHTDSTGEPVLLRRALRGMDPSVRSLAVDDPDRSMAIAGYGAMLRRHFMHGGPVGVLDTAVAAGDAAVQAATKPTRRCAVLNSLATTLITRFEHSGDPADLDSAAEAADEASRHAPDGTAPQHTALAQLGIIAAHRFRLDSNPEHLDTSIEMFDQALSAMPEMAPGRAAVANHLGRSLHTLHQRLGRRRPYRWARKVLTEAAEQSTAPADQRLRAAGLCGRLAAQAHRWSEALESFATAVELLPLVTRGKRVVASPTSQQRWSTLAADAAACALECGEPERAVELLEHGRGAILADFLPTGGELGELHRQEPHLTDRAVRLRRLLDRPSEEPVLTDLDHDEAEERNLLANAWDGLLREVRNLPDHGHHLRALPFTELANAGEQGAVVLVNLSQYRSDALIVFGGRVLTVPLSEATPEAALEQANLLLTAVQEGNRQAQAESLDWLWHKITRPVLDRMGYVRPPTQGQRWPRIWWNVTGALAFLPLHAATAKSGDSALDRVVSSYTPTLRTLVRALRRPVPDEGTALVVAGSQEEVGRELPPSNRILAQYWPTAEVVSRETDDATELTRRLPQHPWVHVCEPSVQYPAQPAAGLVLDREPPERPLGIVELGPVILDEAEFGYLGACQTVAEPPSAAAMPLAGALGYAGFTHVIGTLWGVDEESSTRVHADVYGELFGGEQFETDFAAHALHTAAYRLRAEHPSEPARWAGHVHVGP